MFPTCFHPFVKISITAISLIVHGACLSQSFFDQRNGFKSLKFGTPITHFLEIYTAVELPKSDSISGLYELRMAEFSRIGNCKISKTIVRFYDEKLVTFNIFFNGESACNCIQTALQQIGKSKLTKEGSLEVIKWKGKKTFASFKWGSKRRDCKLLIEDIAMKEKYEQDLKNLGKKNLESF